ncbi:MAG TPA: DUF4404 family protein [Telluria sp.]|nr:DUF4404 family protein [Telluria sp.]
MQPETATELKTHLQQLHDNLSRTGEVDAELRSLLTQLDGDIHALLLQREAGEVIVEPEVDDSLADRAREISASFATRHPKLEPALRELSNMLASMGI